MSSPINNKYKTSREQRNDVTNKISNFFDFNGGECCQALECGSTGRARYLPSLIALLNIFYINCQIVSKYVKKLTRNDIGPVDIITMALILLIIYVYHTCIIGIAMKIINHIVYIFLNSCRQSTKYNIFIVFQPSNAFQKQLNDNIIQINIIHV